MLNHNGKCLTLTHFVCNTKLRFDFWILYHILSSLNWCICWKEGVEILNLECPRLWHHLKLSGHLHTSGSVWCRSEFVYYEFYLDRTRFEAVFMLNTGFFYNQCSLENISAKLNYIASCTFHSTFKVKCLVGGAKSL